ncbi:hypothetical protein [Chitiniphilus shinanonensis]|uniref:hypothetical protein n=1 Tax=Chitiniphilus shinanonensis TaxID=553088 RepID=UPI00039D06D6|nr:hypothetical protein [Chitiniphilus shinanonensis]
MLFKTLLLMTLLLTLTGCVAPPSSQKQWVMEGVSADNMRRDLLTCKQYGMQSAEANGLSGNMFVSVWIKDETAKCMKELGYELK